MKKIRVKHLENSREVRYYSFDCFKKSAFHWKSAENEQMGSTWINQLDRLTACSAHLIRHKNVSLLDRIVTCNEKWVSYVYHKRSSRWLDKDEAPKHCLKAAPHPCKTLLTVWWSVHGIIKYFLLPVNKTVNNSWNILRIYSRDSWKMENTAFDTCKLPRTYSAARQRHAAHITIDSYDTKWAWVCNFTASAIFARLISNRFPSLQTSGPLPIGQNIYQHSRLGTCY